MTTSNTDPGAFIVFEGANGTGKSTVLRAVASSLRESGVAVLETREPGGTETAERIRALLLDPAVDLDGIEQLSLFNAARRHHLRRVIRPALAAGKIVLCDRYVASTLVFQTLHHDNGDQVCDADVIRAHNQICGGFSPDLQITLDASIDTILARRNGRDGLDRFESSDKAYELACIAKFRASARILGFRNEIIDANDDAPTVLASILSAIAPLAHDKTWAPVFWTGRYWSPLIDPKTSAPYWSFEPSEAHRFAAEQTRDHPVDVRFVPRKISLRALQSEGLSTHELETLRA